jgi:hypothetical protein
VGAHRLDLLAVYVAQAERGHVAHVRQLGQPPQLAGSGVPCAVERVEDVGVGVDVHHVDRGGRGHAAAEGEAHRVVAAHGDEQRAAGDDAPGRLGHPREAALDVRALDRHVADVGHRHAGEVVVAGLDVVEARAGLELLPGAQPRCRGPLGLAGAIARLRRPAVERHAEERDLRLELVEVGHARSAEERPGSGSQQHSASVS